MSEARRHKSRAGCQQCKRRKVKCDLGIPNCNQCRRQKLQCPGYQKPLKWVSDEVSSSRPQAQTHPSRTSKSPTTSQTSRSSSSSGSYIPGSCLGEPLYDDTTTLIHHYFTRVCRIAGCFDSPFSPFRIIPPLILSTSKPIFLLLQASSAAQLSRQHPTMRIKALRLQTEAFSAVRDDIGMLMSGGGGFAVSDELMLASIFAGLTSAWYDVNDTGLSHVLGSQILLSLWLMGRVGQRLNYQQTFILGAYVYWFMISSFAVGDPWQSFCYQEALQSTLAKLDMCRDVVDDTDVPEEQRKVYPHPLTGFSNEVCLAVGKVGSLCRLHYISKGQMRDFLEEKAGIAEEELLDLEQFDSRNFQDPQDPKTNVEEILSVREAYRLAGLLQLYDTFPHLLHRHTEPQDYSPECEIEEEPHTPAQHNFLLALSIHILRILATIPPSSGTRVLQGLPALIAATWLVDPHPSTSDIFNHPRLPLTPSVLQPSPTSLPSSSQAHPTYQPHLDQLHSPSSSSLSQKQYWRDRVRDGLRKHDEYVGLQQVSRVLDIVEEVWRLDDRAGYGNWKLGRRSGEKCKWMVVVARKGLQTLYG
ncbi:hypothetical protein ONS95_011846 [Cadophora gregata]|uniref:uncharacterized protein n=1 Tax=Cadophora gregata TaxID=51156 RepID=UPI0026DC2D82|nr:uncharacterized protein ONS95_011846 [Cadophora gregata]KAK0117506.1 hypothetical protein ONS95_011846 [Cadophora gregata]KAK0122561.1 hypothetical protein ONS96_009603 [Cadophora gregata f. sp. sojae]